MRSIFTSCVGGLLLACSSEPPAGPLAPAPPAVPDKPDVSSEPATYHRDVEPLLARECLACHVSGGLGPFPLTTFAEVVTHKEAIATAVASRLMPPWLPGEGCQTYVGERRLSQREIDLIVSWVRSGAREGDPAPPPAARSPNRLAWVDRTVDIGADYVSRVKDDWRCFVIDPGLADDAMLVGYNLVPTARGQVHHAAFVDADLASARAKDDAEEGLGWSCPGDSGVGGVDRVLGSWASGFGAVTFPDGHGIPLQQGKAIVVQIHYHLHPGQTETIDRTKIELQLARGSVQTARIATLGAGVVIPPRALGHRSSAITSLGAKGMIWSLQPHMHLLGRHLSVRLKSPTQGDKCLLDVPAWRYQWEEMAMLRDGIPFDETSLVELTCTWDNPSDHVVSFGLGLEDEMCDLAMLVTD